MALNYLHHKNIVHRDIKLENVLMKTDSQEDLTLKVTDFGFAKLFQPDVGMNELLGSPIYMAPEILNRRSYGASVDIWAAGIILHILVVGEPPFIAQTKKEVFTMIRKLELNLWHKAWERVSANCRDIVSKILIKDPKERPDAETLLKHPWFDII